MCIAPRGPGRAGGSGAAHSSAAATLRNRPGYLQDVPDSSGFRRIEPWTVRLGQIRFHRICLDLGITAWIAWLVAPAVDLSVVGLLTGIRFLSLHGYADVRLARPRFMLRFCGLLTLALNTSGALGHRMFGTALVDAVGPALLIGWSDPWLPRQIYTVCAPAAPEQPEAAPAAEQPPVLPAGLLTRVQDLDAEHRAATGRPISRDTLRARLRIGRDRPAP
jgi:hypothetical protein